MSKRLSVTGIVIVGLLIALTLGLGGCSARTGDDSFDTPSYETESAKPGSTDADDSREQTITADDLDRIEAELGAIEKSLLELQMPEDDFAEIESVCTRPLPGSHTSTLPAPSPAIPVEPAGTTGAVSYEYASARFESDSTGWFTTAPLECRPL
jgi:hypothetical protein